MAHNINTMAYVGEKPWHGLGKELQNPMTSDEAIREAGLDWEVKKQPLFIEGGKQAEGWVGMVRQDTKEVLGVASPKYHVVQNRDAFSFFDEVVGKKEAMYETAGCLGKGERIWMLAKLPKSIMVFKDDIVDKYLVLTNGHDARTMLKVYFTPIRVVCQNTLNMSLQSASNQVSLVHRPGIMDKVKEARKVLGLALEFYDEFEVSAKALVKVKMNTRDTTEYFNRVLGITETEGEKVPQRKLNIRTQLFHLFEKGKGNDMVGIRHSAWTALNAVTEYVDWNLKVKNQADEPSKKLESNWFGSGARMKEHAYDLALDLINN